LQSEQIKKKKPRVLEDKALDHESVQKHDTRAGGESGSCKKGQKTSVFFFEVSGWREDGWEIIERRNGRKGEGGDVEISQHGLGGDTNLKRMPVEGKRW